MRETEREKERVCETILDVTIISMLSTCYINKAHPMTAYSWSNKNGTSFRAILSSVSHLSVSEESLMTSDTQHTGKESSFDFTDVTISIKSFYKQKNNYIQYIYIYAMLYCTV